MPTTQDTDLVFLDLSDAFQQLDDARPSPKEVRRAFSRYVELSQRLTSAMRKDFSKRTGQPWAATSFMGWTAATELLKYLRNQDQHGEQVFVTVHDRHYYTVPEDVEIAGLPGRQFIVNSHWQMTDQMLDRPPEGTEVKLRDPGSPLDSGSVLRPVKTESQYVLYPRNAKDKRRIEAAGVSDVYVIARETFATLGRYYEFFCEQTGA
jgi:hypothetical protein